MPIIMDKVCFPVCEKRVLVRKRIYFLSFVESYNGSFSSEWKDRKSCVYRDKILNKFRIYSLFLWPESDRIGRQYYDEMIRLFEEQE